MVFKIVETWVSAITSFLLKFLITIIGLELFTETCCLVCNGKAKTLIPTVVYIANSVTP